ncbi:hypothetical protein [Vibrio phage vB_VmeM-Yong XC32]|nr:hypothetical protein [Vibrio phage vB_VmeM-Yong XC31]QAX96467.1 hypothetical protein [Vibrio phage vB_VmeM-Yong XC32]QAX96784.1 hypothetical protein [Vibrio phage vB_VmeM-Yong MS31]QAX97103.1 hypothetical protein [Vibrio phage vB_VmeM-Yong MS32]
MNFEKIVGGVYLVHTQAGFNQALYQSMGIKDSGYSRKEVRNAVTNWPHSYPCLVWFNDQMFEQGRIFVGKMEITHMDAGHKEQLAAKLDSLSMLLKQ